MIVLRVNFLLLFCCAAALFGPLMATRACLFKKYQEAWSGLAPNLRAKPAYTIRLFREAFFKHFGHVVFPTVPDNMEFQPNKMLIQSRHSESGKNLCILSSQSFCSPELLEAFTWAMIVSEDSPNQQQDIFQDYKDKMRLPKHTRFDYEIFAWVTENDCAFYNLGIPVYSSKSGREVVPLNSTKVVTETAFDGSYSVQITRTKINKRPVDLMFISRWNRETALKLTAVDSEYNSFTNLFDQMNQSNLKVAQKNQPAIWINKTKNNPITPISYFSRTKSFLRQGLENFLKQGVDYIRTQMFPEARDYNDIFSKFPRGTTSIIYIKDLDNDEEALDSERAHVNYEDLEAIKEMLNNSAFKTYLTDSDDDTDVSDFDDELDNDSEQKITGKIVVKQITTDSDDSGTDSETISITSQ